MTLLMNQSHGSSGRIYRLTAQATLSLKDIIKSLWYVAKFWVEARASHLARRLPMHPAVIHAEALKRYDHMNQVRHETDRGIQSDATGSICHRRLSEVKV